MYYVTGTLVLSGNIYWEGGEDYPSGDKGVVVQFQVYTASSPPRSYEVIRIVKGAIESNPIPWIVPGYKQWILDLDKLRKSFKYLNSLQWLSGKIQMEPEVGSEEEKGFNSVNYKGLLSFYISPEILKEVPMASPPLQIPPEIQESLKSFKKDHPDSSKVAFIMMQFGETRAHKKIVKTIKDALSTFGIVGVRSDDKEYHDDLLYNVMTYLHGCGFGIAVFERIEAEKFSPNVSLEVGYMMASRKNVCILKDETLKPLPVDLIGKLYKPFDPQDPENTIPKQITKWLEDKGIIE